VRVQRVPAVRSFTPGNSCVTPALSVRLSISFKQEITMMKIRHTAVMLALIGGATTASAQTTIITREPQTRVVTQPVELTPAQRTVIYRTIVRERAAPTADVEVRVGTRVPETVQLRAVPETVAVEVPAIRSYRYMVVNNRVLLVDPATSTVIAEIVE
jgi:hypothetical protein